MRADKDLLQKLINITIGAGDVIMPFYRGDANMEIQKKDDSSPVTLADQQAEDHILKELNAIFPGTPVVAEEKCSNGDVPDLEAETGNLFFLVDPLDGTKEFIQKRGEFTVNIALIKDNVPIAGVIYAPAIGDIYAGAENYGAYLITKDVVEKTIKNAERLVIVPKGKAEKAVASRSHMSKETTDFIQDRGINEFISAGSSLKFCMVASGKADIYPRFGRTMEWDIAAGDAILRAAGGVTVTIDNKPMIYGKINQLHDSDFANPFFIAKHNCA